MCLLLPSVLYLYLLIRLGRVFLALKVARTSDAHADVDDLKSGRQQLAGGWWVVNLFRGAGRGLSTHEPPP